MADGFIPGDYKKLNDIGTKDPEGYTYNENYKSLNESDNETEIGQDTDCESESESEYTRYDYASSAKDDDSGIDTDSETNDTRKEKKLTLPFKFDKKQQNKIENIKILQEEDDFTSED